MRAAISFSHSPSRLREGVILARPNRFIMDVDFGTADEQGEPAGIVRCHCPAVSRIGGLDLAGRPCLVSDSRNPKRKMPLTVEAYSLQQPDDPDKHWIGINQNASNRYVEHFLREGAFAAITGPVRDGAPRGALGRLAPRFPRERRLVSGSEDAARADADGHPALRAAPTRGALQLPPSAPCAICASWPLRWPTTSGPPSSTVSTTTTSGSASTTAPPTRRCSPQWTPAAPPAWSCGRPISK